MYSAQVPDDISFQAADDHKNYMVPIRFTTNGFCHERVIKDFIEKKGR